MGRSNAFAMRSMAALPLLCVIAAGPAAPVRAQTGALDGKSYEGVFLERGKTRGDADTLTFRDGRFRSSACDRYGYGDAPYRVVSEGGVTRFEAVTQSPKYGKLEWSGVVRGDRLDATAMMVQEGKPPVENWIVAGQKK
jgi:hypothetical protein